MAATMESILTRLAGKRVPRPPALEREDQSGAHPPRDGGSGVEPPVTSPSVKSTDEGVRRPPVWAVAGAKGGVGKSLVSMGLASYLGMTSRDVLLVDGDLGAPNLHTLLGVRNPQLTLGSFVKREVEDLQEVIIDTEVPGVRFIPGSRNLFGAANPKAAQKERLLRHLRAVPADVIVLDLGAGTSFHVLDLFKDAERKVIVLTPEPTAIQNGYDFLKMAVYRELLTHLGRSGAPSPAVREVVTEALEGSANSRVQSLSGLFENLVAVSEEAAQTFNQLLQAFHAHLVVNTATERQARQVAEAVLQICHDALGIRVDYAGHIQSDPEIARGVRKRRPFLLDHRDGERWQEVAAIASALGPVERALATERILAPEPEAADLESEDGSPSPDAQTPDLGEEVEPCAASPVEAAEEKQPRPASEGGTPDVSGDARSSPPPNGADDEQEIDEDLALEDHEGTSHAVGRNQNVSRQNKTYHVQTEDLGRPRETIRSVIYVSGQLVLSQSNPYTRFREKKGPDFTVQQMVDYQHRAVVAAIKAGKLG